MSAQKVHSERFIITPEFSNVLNLLRWLSALIVVISHVRSIFFVDAADLPQHTYLIDAFYFITGFGHQAVVVFFVLSGYLVGGSALRDYYSNRLSFDKYIINRVSRLYVVLLPALFLTVLLDGIGYRLFNTSGIYTGLLPSASLDYNVMERYTLELFIANICMLQESFTFETFGSNGPLWSLAYEFWYYILFFLILNVIYTKNRAIKSITAIVIGIIAITISPQILLYFIIWLMGIGLYFIPKIPSVFYYIALLMLSCVLVIIRMRIIVNHSDFILAAVLVLFLSQIQFRKLSGIMFMKKFNTTFADFSYSLYLIHFPVMLLAFAVFVQTGILKDSNVPNTYSSMVFGCVIVAVYVISYFFALVTEGRTKQVREYLFRLKGDK